MVPDDPFSSQSALLCAASLGRKYAATLSFFKLGARDTTSIPDIPGSVGFGKSTSFQMLTAGTGPQPKPLLFTSFTRLLDGTFQLKLTGQANVDYVIEASSDLSQWTQIATRNSVSGMIEFIDPLAATATQRFYRAKSAL